MAFIQTISPDQIEFRQPVFHETSLRHLETNDVEIARMRRLLRLLLRIQLLAEDFNEQPNDLQEFVTRLALREFRLEVGGLNASILDAA